MVEQAGTRCVGGRADGRAACTRACSASPASRRCCPDCAGRQSTLPAARRASGRRDADDRAARSAPGRPDDACWPPTRSASRAAMAPLGSPARSRGYDLVLLAAALPLCLIGALLVWSATRTGWPAGGNPQTYLAKHLLNTALGGGVAVRGARGRLRGCCGCSGRCSTCVSLLGLLAVFVVGSTINGAHAWIVLGGGFEIQPAEFAKLGLIVGAGGAVRPARGAPADRRGPPTAGDVAGRARRWSPSPLGADHAAAGPRLGDGASRPPRSGCCIAAGVRARWLVGLLLLGVLGAVLAVKAGVLADYQLARFAAFTAPGPRPAGGRLQHHPGAHRDRARRPVRQGAVPRRADQRSVRPGAADRLRVLGGRRGAGLRRVGG